MLPLAAGRVSRLQKSLPLPPLPLLLGFWRELRFFESMGPAPPPSGLGFSGGSVLFFFPPFPTLSLFGFLVFGEYFGFF